MHDVAVAVDTARIGAQPGIDQATPEGRTGARRCAARDCHPPCGQGCAVIVRHGVIFQNILPMTYLRKIRACFPITCWNAPHHGMVWRHGVITCSHNGNADREVLASVCGKQLAAVDASAAGWRGVGDRALGGLRHRQDLAVGVVAVARWRACSPGAACVAAASRCAAGRVDAAPGRIWQRLREPIAAQPHVAATVRPFAEPG